MAVIPAEAPGGPPVVVVGGAAMDIKARSANRAARRTSNPGSVSWNPGGVGRNVAENLARLGHTTHLVATVGDDAFGHELLARTAAAGVDVGPVARSSHKTGTYVALLDHDGELLAGVSDMTATEEMRVDQVAGWRELICGAGVVVIDGNLPLDVAGWVLGAARAARVRVVADPVSAVKAGRLTRLLHTGLPLFAVTPNLDELGALVGHPVADSGLALTAAAAQLHQRGVDHVWISRGPGGSVLSSTGQRMARLDAPPATAIDVTGAGDAMTAGFIHGLLRGEAPIAAARLGHRAAALTVASPETVRPDLGLVLTGPRAPAPGVCP